MKRKNIPLITALLLIICIFSGCNSESEGDYVNKAADMAYSNAPLPEASSNADYGYYDGSDYDGYFADAGSSAPSFSSGTSVNGSDRTDYYENDTLRTGSRKLIKRVSLTIETLEFEKSCGIIEQYAGQFGGYIESSNVHNNDYYTTYYNNYSNRTASYTIRIPNDLVDQFITASGNIGSILTSSTSTEDITLGYLDVESRAKALEIQQERLLSLLEQANSVENIISLEDRLSQVTYELESKESLLRNYDNLVSYSTVNIMLNEVREITEIVPEPETIGERISRGFSDSIKDITEGLKNFFVWFVVNIPYILLFLIVVAVAVLIVICLVRLFKRICIRKYEKDLKKKGTAGQDFPDAAEEASKEEQPAVENYDTQTGEPLEKNR